MRTCLVVCYSRTGLTAKVGQEIASLCGGDFELICEERSRNGLLGFLLSVMESVLRKQPKILPCTKDPADYALIVLGTPVWAGHMAAPMRTYLLHHCKSFYRVALFCTMGSKGGVETLNEMAALCGKAPMASVSMTDAEIQRNSYHNKLMPLLSRLRRLLKRCAERRERTNGFVPGRRRHHPGPPVPPQTGG